MLFWRRRMKRNDEPNSRQLIVFFFSIGNGKKFNEKSAECHKKKNVWSSTLEKIGQWTVLSVEKEEKNIKKPEGSQESRNHLSAVLLYTQPFSSSNHFLGSSYTVLHVYLSFPACKHPRSCSAERIVRNQSASNLPTVRYDLQPTLRSVLFKFQISGFFFLKENHRLKNPSECVSPDGYLKTKR